MRNVWRKQCREEPAPYGLEKPCLIWEGKTWGTEVCPKASIYHPDLKKTTSGNRAIFYDAYGYLPETVNHHCDVSLCMELTHLYGGTQAQNMRDRALRSRTVTRTRVLSAHLAMEIRDLYEHGIFTQRELAPLYGVNSPMISHVVTGRRWKAA